MCTRPCCGSRGQTLASSTRPWVPLKWSVPRLATERRGADSDPQPPPGGGRWAQLNPVWRSPSGL